MKALDLFIPSQTGQPNTSSYYNHLKLRLVIRKGEMKHHGVSYKNIMNDPLKLPLGGLPTVEQVVLFNQGKME